MEWLPILVIGLAVLACPLVMRFGMRGMHGAHGSEQAGQANAAGRPDAAARLRELEREVAELKQQLTVSQRDESKAVARNGRSPDDVGSGAGKEGRGER